jgi:hypothetical protein
MIEQIKRLEKSIKAMKVDLENEIIITGGFNKMELKEWRKELESHIKHEEEELKKLLTKIK